MIKNERGNVYINWVVAILVLLFIAVITIRVLVGENGLIQQMKEKDARNKTEQNIMIQLTDENNN